MLDQNIPSLHAETVAKRLPGLGFATTFEYDPVPLHVKLTQARKASLKFKFGLEVTF